MNSLSLKFSIGILIFCFCLACNDKIESTIESPVLNGIHLKIENWKPGLIRSEDLYYYQDLPFSGVLENHSSGVRSVVTLSEGLLEGSVEEWYSNGSKRTEKKFENGYENGLQKGWHKNSKLSYTYTSANGIRVDSYKEYYPNGNVQVIASYDNGYEYKKKIYDADGNILVNYEIRDGRYYGLLGSSSCISNLKNYGNTND